MSEQIRYLDRGAGHRIAYVRTPGEGPGVLFCGGFKSDMTGSKAQCLEALCRRQGRAFVRFDYFGHGQSSGAFPEGTIGRWQDDALAVLDQLTEGPQILVGSSMGGWIALLLALARPERVVALLGIAPAPDFTETLVWQSLDARAQARMVAEGQLVEASEYDEEPYVITLKLVEEGRDHLVMPRTQALRCPVRIIQGMEDADVPWQTGLALVEALGGEDVELTLVKQGDHRLSGPADLRRMERVLDALIESLQS
ncbi:MAG: alpha/beta hydrolase [Gammaproteobacteria bacterium]|nr:alpha/beta hydrolase [Gammaproteobacteria bacterium]